MLDAQQIPLLLGLLCKSITPVKNAKILEDGKLVGRVRTADWSHFLKCGIAYVQFEVPGDWVGKTLPMRIAENEIYPCEIVLLPFYDHEKRIPRGLDKSIP